MDEGNKGRPRRVYRARRSGLIAALLVLGPLAACLPRIHRPSVEVISVRVERFGITGGDAVLELEVGNPNDRELPITGVDYELQVADERSGGGWTPLTRGTASEALSLPPRDTILVTVPIPFEYRALGAAIRSLFQEGTVPYRLLGEIRARGPLGEIRLPFDQEGVFRP